MKPGIVRRLLGIGPKRPVPIIQDVAVGAPPGVSTQGAKAPVTRQKSVVIRYQTENIRSMFTEPEYDLAEIYRAMDTESYLRLSFDKHQELILKNQWRLVGQNSKTLAYVHRRLTEISWSQDEPLESIIENGVEDLVESSNTFYVFARKESGPKYESKFGRQLHPITGIFSPSPASMRPWIEKSVKGTSEIKKWWQMDGATQVREFSVENVVHMPFRKKRSNVFGTPYVTPVLDDILALRRIEELVEVIIKRNAFPFFHYRVGTEKEPAREYDNGHSEVDDVRMAVEDMPFDGGIVTPFRHEILVLGAKNRVIMVDPYLKYFEDRALSGVNLSGVDVGRGGTANRGTATTMSKGLSDRCTRFQLFFSSRFTFYVLDEIIRETGEIPTPENRVYLTFPTIDTTERRAHENHTMALYQGYMLTEEEARVDIGRDPIRQIQRPDMFYNRVAKPMALIKSMDELSGLGAKPPAVASTSAKERPSNQSGTLAAKPKVPANDAQLRAYQLWEDFRDSVLGELDGVEEFCSSLHAELEPVLGSQLAAGLQKFSDASGIKGLYVGDNVKRAFIEDIVNPALDNVHDLIRSQLDRGSSALERVAILDSLWPVANELVGPLLDYAADYGFGRAAQAAKKKTVQWRLTDDACEDCKTRAAVPVQVHRFSYADMQRHSSCLKGFELPRES